MLASDMEWIGVEGERKWVWDCKTYIVVVVVAISVSISVLVVEAVIAMYVDVASAVSMMVVVHRSGKVSREGKTVSIFFFRYRLEGLWAVVDM